VNLTIVSYYFPPSRIANARRPALLARELARSGHTVRVLTCGGDPAGGEAAEMGVDCPGVRVERIADPTVAWRRRWSRSRLLKSVLRRMWPDEALFWVLAVVRRLRSVPPGGPVLVMVLPVSSLLVPFLLRRTGVDVIVDYLESVTLFRRQVPYEFLPHRRMLHLLELLERAALRRARGAVFTSGVNRDAYVRAGLVDRERSRYIPHACDPNPLAGSRLSCDGPLVIAHVGYFNRDRSPEVFLRGLACFLRRKPEAACRLRVDLFGNGLGPHHGLGVSLGLDSVIRERGETDYEDCLAAIARSHVLLLVASSCHTLFFPSKLPEYLAARRPILALLPPDSDARPLLSEAGRNDWVCDEDSTDSVAQSLEGLWIRFLDGTLGHALPVYDRALFGRHLQTWVDALRELAPFSSSEVTAGGR